MHFRKIALIALGSLLLASPNAFAIAKRKTKSAPKKQAATTNADQATQDAQKLDASGLKAVPVEQVKKGGDPVQQHGPKKKLDADPRGLMTSDASDILDTIRGINLLLKKNPEKNDKIKLLLNRSMATYSLARKRLLQNKSMKLDKTSFRLLSVASNDAKSITQMNDISKGQKGRAYYIHGLTLIYLEKPNDARNAFIQAININPRSQDTGWMALYIGEDLFDSAKFNEAVPYYSNYYDVMDEREVSIAKYKLAWCYLNLKNERKAVALFEELIRKNPAEGFGHDSIKDLAYVLTTYSTEREVLDLSEKLFPKAKDKKWKIEFLAAALGNYEIQNAMTLDSKILARLLEIEEDPIKRLQYLLAGVRTTRREYASAQHYDALIKVRNYVRDQHLDASSKEMAAAKSSMELETQNLIKSFVETFAGRTKTPEKNLTKDKIAMAVKNLFAFYDNYFSDAQAYPTILRLWLDVCMDTSDWKCADTVAQKILDRKDMKAVQGRAALDQLTALENLAKDPKNGADQRLVAKLEEFAQRQKGSEGWLDITKRLGELYIRQKDYNKAIPLFQDVYDRAPNAENYYRVQWARFESGDYKAVVEDARAPKGKPDPRTADLKREAALQLAQSSRKSDDFDTYTQHIKEFLASNPSPEKAMAARKDWFFYLIEKDRNGDLSREVGRLPVDIRYSKDMSDILEQTWSRDMKAGMFKEAAAVVASNDKHYKPNQANKLRHFLAALGAGSRPPLDELKELASDSRTYILGVLSLVRPEWALFYLNDFAPLRSKDLKTIGAVALRMQSGEWSIKATPRAVKLLGPNFSFVEAPSMAQSAEEKMIKAIYFPTKALKSQATIGKYVQDIVAQTRKVRAKVGKNLKNYPLPVQLRTVYAAKDLEARTGNFIKNQPLPPDLKGDQLAEYEKGVGDVVKEFTDQSAEFDKLGQSLGDAQGKNAADTEAQYLPLPDLTRWPWPTMYNSDAMQGLKSLVENHNFLGALLVVDLFRPKPLENNTDYYAIREGILFSTKDTKALRRYVLEELQQTGQNDLVKVWKDQVGAMEKPAPASKENQGKGGKSDEPVDESDL